MSQGDPEASLGFCVAWQEDVQELDAKLSIGDGICRFRNGNGYAIGPASVVFPAIERFARKVHSKHLLNFQPDKSEVLEGEGQGLWTVLHCSLAQKFDLHLSLCYPSDIADAAMKLDSYLWSFLKFAAGLSIPKGQEGGNSCIPLFPGINSLERRSFQEWLIPQPGKLSGFGLRWVSETSPVAFIGGVNMSLPSFTGERGICQVLEQEIGNTEGTLKWQDFLALGSRTSQEFEAAWLSLQAEANQCSNYLETELGSQLSHEIAVLGSKVEI